MIDVIGGMNLCYAEQGALAQLDVAFAEVLASEYAPLTQCLVDLVHGLVSAVEVDDELLEEPRVPVDSNTR